MTENDYSREEIRDAFVNSMRGFNSGNSIDVVQEMNHLYQGEGEELIARRQLAAEGYDLWDSLGGAFNENTTAGEKVDAVADYARSLILDPVNAVSLGFGKLGGAAATRGSTQALKAIARAAGENASKAALARGVSKELAAQAAVQAKSRVMTRGFQELAATGGQAAATSAVRRRAVGDIVGATALDSAAAVASDAGMQKVDRLTGRQDEYSAAQGAISAAGGLVGGALQGGLLLARGWSPTDTAGSNIFKGEVKFEEQLKVMDTAKGAAARMAETDEDVAQRALRYFLTPFKQLVAEGSQITTDAQPEQFATFYKGLQSFFDEAGIPIDSLNARLGQRRAGWYHDVITDENFPTQWREEIEETLGAAFKVNGEALSIDDVMKKGAEVASISGRVLGSLGARSRALGKAADEDVVAQGLDIASPTGAKLTDSPDKVKEFFGNFQNGFIRMLVTHPATTALNVVGWANASAMQSTVDMIRGTLYGGYSVLKNVSGDEIGAAQYRKLAANAFKAQRTKLRNLVNASDTRDEVLDYFTHRPEAQEIMFRYLSGGIKNEDAVAKLNRILDDTPDPRTGVTKAMDFMQTMYGVTAQDTLTKSQEFMYALDLNIRNKYGMPYVEFMQRDDIYTILKDPQKGASYQEYMEIEALAVEQALSNVFARKFGERVGGTNLEFVANILEEVRNVPVLGALLPFGQFFNNAMVFMADHTGVSLALKPYTKTSKTAMELSVRAAAGWGMIAKATSLEIENLEDGLAWHEERNSEGKVVTRIYDFPLSFWKMIGRMGAHTIRDGGVPAPLFKEFLKTFSIESVTRGIGDAAGSIQEAATEIFSGEGDMKEIAVDVLSSSVGMYASGGSRFLDPINTAMAFAEGDDYVAPSRNIGNKGLNNALRYTDQIVDALIDLDNIPGVGKAYDTQNYNAVQGRNIGVNPGRIAGSREVVPTSSIGRLFNDIGKPQWQTNIRMDNKEMQEVYEQYLFPLLEYHADTVMESGRWDTFSLRQKETALKDIMTMAKQEIKDSFAATPTGPRAEAGLIITINNLKNQGRESFQTMMDVFETDEESLGDLTVHQLQLLLDNLRSAQRAEGRQDEARVTR